MKSSNIKIGILHYKFTEAIHKFLRINHPNIITGYEVILIDEFHKWHQRNQIKSTSYATVEGKGLIKLRNFSEIMHRVCDESDVIITWGLQNNLEILREYQHKPIILSANGQCHWVRQYIEQSEPFHNNYMAVSQMAKLTFSPAIRHKVQVVPNQVDTDVYRPLDKKECRKQLGLPLDKIIVGSFGRNIKDKGYDRFIKAMIHLPDYASLIVGGDTTTENKATFTHSYHEGTMETYFNAIDCFVSLSEREGDSNCIKEAMACKIPCVTTPVGSAIEIATLYDCPNIIIPTFSDSSFIAQAIQQQVLNGNVDSVYEIIKNYFSNKDKLFQHCLNVFLNWNA